MGAKILPLLKGVSVVVVTAVGWLRAVREGTASLGTKGSSSSSAGVNLLRFREPWESSDSDSESKWSLPASEGELESEGSGELDAWRSDARLIFSEAAMGRERRRRGAGGKRVRQCVVNQTYQTSGHGSHLSLFFFLGATRARGGRTKAFRSLAARIEGRRGTGEHTTTLEIEE